MSLLRTTKKNKLPDSNQSAQQRIGARTPVEYGNIMAQDPRFPAAGGSMNTDAMAANPFGNIQNNPRLPTKHQLGSGGGRSAQNPNPAYESLKKFGGMINENIIQPIGDAINPVTQAERIYGMTQNVGSAMKKYDKDYGDRIRGDLSNTAQEGRLQVETPQFYNGMPQSPLVQSPQQTQQQVPQALLPQQTQYSPENQMRSAIDKYGISNIADNGERETVKLSPTPQELARQPIPDNFIATKDGKWVPRESVLPGNNFNEQNTKGYFEKTGYNDVDWDKRRQENAGAVDRINAGTRAMAEVRQMRTGVKDGQRPSMPVLNQGFRSSLPQEAKKTAENQGKLPSIGGYHTKDATPKPAAQSLPEAKFAYEQQQGVQRQANESAKYDAELKNIVQSDHFKSIRKEQDPNKRAYMISRLPGLVGYSYEDLINYIDKATNPNTDDFAMLSAK